MLGILLEGIGQFVVCNPEMLKEMEVPVMSQAINAYYTVTASAEFHEKERLRAKVRYDEAQALYNTRKEREFESLIKKLRKKRIP